MTITIKATQLPGGTDPNAVAGASEGEMHELKNKLHETVRVESVDVSTSTPTTRKKLARLSKKNSTSQHQNSLFSLLQDSGCYEMKLDAMGAETAADVELAVFEREGEGEEAGGGEGGEGGGNEKKRDVVLKLGSGKRSFVSLPADADVGSIEGILGDGSFVVRCGKKK